MSDGDGHQANADTGGLERLHGSLPWMKAAATAHHRTKLFKSGNSLAVRIPAGTKLSAGMEMEMLIEDGQFVSVRPVDAPKRKFNVAKVAGSAHDLRYIPAEDRMFAPRPSTAPAHDGPPRDKPTHGDPAVA